MQKALNKLTLRKPLKILEKNPKVSKFPKCGCACGCTILHMNVSIWGHFWKNSVRSSLFCLWYVLVLLEENYMLVDSLNTFVRNNYYIMLCIFVHPHVTHNDMYIYIQYVRVAVSRGFGNIIWFFECFLVQKPKTKSNSFPGHNKCACPKIVAHFRI